MSLKILAKSKCSISALCSEYTFSCTKKDFFSQSSTSHSQSRAPFGFIPFHDEISLPMAHYSLGLSQNDDLFDQIWHCIPQLYSASRCCSAPRTLCSCVASVWKEANRSRQITSSIESRLGTASWVQLSSGKIGKCSECFSAAVRVGQSWSVCQRPFASAW